MPRTVWTSVLTSVRPSVRLVMYPSVYVSFFRRLIENTCSPDLKIRLVEIDHPSHKSKCWSITLSSSYARQAKKLNKKCKINEHTRKIQHKGSYFTIYLPYAAVKTYSIFFSGNHHPIKYIWYLTIKIDTTAHRWVVYRNTVQKKIFVIWPVPIKLITFIFKLIGFCLWSKTVRITLQSNRHVCAYLN